MGSDAVRVENGLKRLSSELRLFFQAYGHGRSRTTLASTGWPLPCAVVMWPRANASSCTAASTLEWRARIALRVESQIATKS